MPGPESPEPRLAFLVFRSRSGSTLVADRLSRHPQVLVSPESRVAPRLVRFFRRQPSPDYARLAGYMLEEKKLADWGIDAESLAQRLRADAVTDWAGALRSLCRLYRDRVKPGARVVVIKKSGWYYKHMPLLLRSFPEALSIWMLRDPRAIYNSARKAIHSERGRPMGHSLLKNAFGWRLYARYLLHARRDFPRRVMTVRYESFLDNTLAELQRLWRALELHDIDDDQRRQLLAQDGDSHLVTDATRHLHGNVSRAPMRDRATGWRNELGAREAFIIQLVCGPGMRRLGYTDKSGPEPDSP